MSSTLDNFFNKAKEVADAVGKVTGEVVDDSRAKLHEMKLSSELKDAYERLGSVTYDSIKRGTQNKALVELVVGEIDAIQSDLAKVRASQPEATERYCPNCGATNHKDFAFCCKCGAALENPVQDPPSEEPQDAPSDAPSEAPDPSNE